jgi:hypothetical protein
MPRWSFLSLADRFWAKVDRSAGGDACWPYVGARDHAGYGQFRLRRGDRWTVGKAHRVALVLGFPGDAAPRPLEDGEDACHDNRCTTRACCRPSHLRAGTRTDNNRDVAQKRRARFLTAALALNFDPSI